MDQEPVQPDWTEIETAYRSGAPLGEIRARFCVSLADLLVYARAGGWTRGNGEPPPGGPSETEPSIRGGRETLPALVGEATSRVIDAVVVETMAQIVEDHKVIARTLRRRYVTELAEFEALSGRLATFLDFAHIEFLATKDDGGNALRAYLSQAVVHADKRAKAFDQLVRTGATVLDIDRAVWGLRDPSTDEGATNWEAILAEIKKPLAPLTLPDNVLEFERKIAVATKRKEAE